LLLNRKKLPNWMHDSDGFLFFPLIAFYITFSILFFANLTNVIKDKYIPEVRVFEILKEH